MRLLLVCVVMCVCLLPALAIAQLFTRPNERMTIDTHVDHSAFDAILKDVVRGESVDYVSLREREPELVKYLDHLAEDDPSRLDRKNELAHLINLYNAAMLKAVLDHRAEDPDWTPAADNFAVFKEPVVHLRDEAFSLNHLEHEIIRKQFDDPRIHAALNCAAISCPPLLPRAYRGDDLDDVLEANMRRFINDPSRNAIDHAGRRLVLSSIFDWYADDFGGKDTLAAYVSKYTDRNVSDYAVSFREYDWSLNDSSAE